jgi:ribonuclease E
MSKKMMVNATHPEENRVAIVEDGILTELDIEVAGREPSKGNIYKAVVVRVETGLQAAFVDYGGDRLGFLQIDEINYTTVKPDYKPAEDGRRPRINDLLHRGQEFLVQITKEERGTKGAALTTNLSLAGRYMVLMPGSQTRGVSRKAESDSQRKELKKAMSSLDLAEGIGYIVRTAALDQTREELERDYLYLIRLYESIKELEQKSKAPALIYKESNLMIRSIRDYFTTDMDEVLIDDAQVFKEAKDFFQMVMPDQAKLVKLHQERRPIFSRYQIEDQIETLSHNKVNLPSGGSIVIDPTEALVAIDVNSGKMASEKGVEATATKSNLEAATEVGRQLRLRDLGGLIVIDFIDMRERKNNRLVEDEVKRSLANDKARVSVGRISKFGLLEMSRQRIKATLTQGSHLPCPHCNGSGHLKSPETQAVALLRKIHASAAKGQVSRVDAQLPIEVAAYLLNNNREELVDMERRYQLQIHIHGNRDFMADQVEIEIQKKEKETAAQPEYVEAGTVPVAVAEIEKKEASEAEQKDAPETEAEPGKKRRRRRRRKPAAARDTQATEQDATESQDDRADVTEATEVADADVPVETTSEQSDTEAPAKKPQRRRSSRTQSTAKDSEATTTDAAASPPETSTSTDKPEEVTADTTEDAETKPKRRRSRRKPRATAEAAPSEPTAETTDQTQTGTAVKPAEQPAAEQKPEEAVAAETKPKPRRPRRTTKKAEATAETADTTEEKVATPATPAKADDAETPPAKKPARRTRKKSVEEQPAQEETAANTGEPQNARAPKLAADTEEKPKRTRASRAKPKVETTEATLQVPAPPEETATEKKPVKKAPARRTSSKATAKKTATAKAADKATTAKSTSTQDPEKEETKPKRTRTVKKKITEAEPASKD